MKKQEFKKKKKNERLRNLWDNFKHSSIWIIGVPEGQEEEQALKSYLRRVKENFPNLVKEIDIQVQEAQSPRKVGPKECHNKTHHN